MKLFLDLRWYFKQEKWNYLAGVLFLMGASLLSMVPPYVVGLLVDQIRLRTLTAENLVKWMVFLVIIGIIYYAFGYFWRQFIFGSSIKLSKQLRDTLFRHFTKMAPQFYHNRRIGDLMAHSTNDIRAVEDAAGDGILTLVDSVSMGAMVILSMAILINWKLTLIALIPMPFMAWATSHYGNLLHERFYKAQAAFSDLNDKVQESISGVRVTKAFGLEKKETQTFQTMSQDVVDKNISVARIDALFDPTITFIVAVSYFLSLIFGAVFVVHGSLTIGQLTSFTLYLGQLVWPMLAFGFLFNIVERGRASYDRIKTLLAIKPDIQDKNQAKAIVPSGNISYQISHFVYPGAEEPALKDIFFNLKKGQTLGVVGKTGSGKTTLWRLLLREFDGYDGQITIGEHPINDLQLLYLRAAIGYVPQDHFLFSATIAENIAFARPEATQDEIEAAAKLAQIHEDILLFKEGYQTVVGERGVTLSGGQKQRISMARALVIHPEILILDDALSAVDAKTEEAILSGIRDNQQNKTTLISTHRLSTIQHADLILVLENGRIVERGSHDELLSANKWYAMMYRRQQLESLVEKGGQPS
ncbi:ABC transporter transmembrane domain-containing protein [Pullulanibacillus sp. KACC 23026]|uniref:ABC transporter transmembrane domain-containing protein n=1 Tax=Pullulanibacillus sp. KACC 23026 TaxID=3028315 RepID=UPI0023AF72A8|nr:ABC transporter transmembrane domain-containing protein [Pullulanibacillus sp. KACC 23026]WEG10835.1 ABC transporter transmembrane domain-containing protein [Pullulanibacillus sp. KACC 23026]